MWYRHQKKLEIIFSAWYDGFARNGNGTIIRVGIKKYIIFIQRNGGIFMKFWKRAMLSATVLMGTTILAACGNGAEESSSDKTNISMFLSKVEYKKEMEASVEKFEEKNPDINIDLTFVGGGEDSESTLKAKFSSGEAPTIFMAAGLEQFVNYKQYAADVSDTESIKNAIPSTID